MVTEVKLRKFEIMSIKLYAGGPGPEQAWRVHYRAIKNKVWTEGDLWIAARNESEARHKAMQRFGNRS